MKSTTSSLRDDALTLISCGIDAVKVDKLFSSFESMDLETTRRIQVLAVGKAALPMSQECQKWLLKSNFEGEVQYDITVPHGYLDSSNPNCYGAGHPKPDAASSAAGKRVVKLAAELDSEDLLICLISGGGSALWADPIEGISQDDLLKCTNVLLKIGTDIHETNAIRSRLTSTGAGKLSFTASPATVLTLLISDVPGDHLNVIASGPTSRPSSIAFLDQVLKNYDLLDLLPNSVSSFLKSLLAKDSSKMFAGGELLLLGSNALATQALNDKARELGYATTKPLTLKGDVREMAKTIAQVTNEYPGKEKRAIVFGGETTVTVSGDGQGGRNQELAMASALTLKNLKRPFTLACAGTDGIDGFSNAAGAWVTNQSIPKAEQLGLKIADFLERNDSHHFFQSMDQQIITGPTHTNVMDIAVLLLH